MKIYRIKFLWTVQFFAFLIALYLQYKILALIFASNDLKVDLLGVMGIFVFILIEWFGYYNLSTKYYIDEDKIIMKRKFKTIEATWDEIKLANKPKLKITSISKS